MKLQMGKKQLRVLDPLCLSSKDAIDYDREEWKPPNGKEAHRGKRHSRLMPCCVQKAKGGEAEWMYQWRLAKMDFPEWNTNGKFKLDSATLPHGT